MSILIKRYPNRKLYDTSSKQYITLDGICDLIRHGEELKVTDNVSGEDLTAVVFSQVIMENEKKRNGSLPRTVLAGLIQSSSTTLDMIRQGLITPLSNLTRIDDEIKQRVEILVEADELTQDQAEELMKKLIDAGKMKISRLIHMESVIKNVLGQRGLITREELSALSNKVDTLSAQLDQMIEVKKQQSANLEKNN